MNEVTNSSRLTTDEIKDFTNNVENELYLLFKKDCNQKYKVKYRSLIFNIRDRKNLTLFRKICEKSIKPYRLVRMEPQEMASQELAQWRENANKHQLDIIKKSELELLACSKSYVLKTHKGEEVVESTKDARVELDPNMAVEDVVLVLNSTSETTDAITHKIQRNTTKNKVEAKDNVKSSTDFESCGHSSHSKNKKHRSSKHSKHKRKRSKDRSESCHVSHDTKKNNRHEIKKEKKHEKRYSNQTNEQKNKKLFTKYDSPTPTQEDFNLIDKILEGSQVILARPGVPCPSTSKEASKPVNFASEEYKEPINVINTVKPTEVRHEPNEEILWTGKINMVDVACFRIDAKHVAGDTKSIIADFPKSLEIVGRITPETVWDYIQKIQKSPNKEIIVIRFSSPDEINYLTLYKYYDSRRRLGVIKSNSPVIKDFYVLPLAAEKELPTVLNSIKGIGFVEGKNKPDLLIGVIVKIKIDKIANPGLRIKVRQICFFDTVMILLMSLISNFFFR